MVSFKRAEEKEGEHGGVTVCGAKKIEGAEACRVGRRDPEIARRSRKERQKEWSVGI